MTTVRGNNISSGGRPRSDNPRSEGTGPQRSRREQQYDGGEELDRYRNDGGPQSGRNQAPNNPDLAASTQIQPAAQTQRAKKVEKKIQRYESNSIDEEEFQDYFTNPIKRKEFDRQRKKQQMREMQNITGFTLGQFGIKNMKAMKEAMPAYPDDDDMPGKNDAQKNYATVSLCCLSVTNPFRNKIIQIVAVNPWFDRFILFVILVNCIFLALDKEVEVITENNEQIDFIFLNIYTMEMILKIIAMGFFMRAHSYLRDSWNILDFMVVILGWVSQIFESGDISAIKVIRILRPLRTINQIPNMPSLVSTILNSLPIMFDVMILFFFMLIMFGTIATQLLGGHLEKRCALPTTETFPNGTVVNGWNPALGVDELEIICIYNDKDKKDAEALRLKAIETVCRGNEDLPDHIRNDPGLDCVKIGNPISGTYTFDNILLSMMNIFQMITLEGWTDMMYIVRDAEQTTMYDIFFVSCVVFGSFVILNLMIAVQASYLDKAFDEEDAREKEIAEKIEFKRRLKQEQEEADEEEYDEEDDGEAFDEDAEGADGQANGSGGRRRSTKNRKKLQEKKGGCCNFKKPEGLVSMSNKVEGICKSKGFEQFVIVLILLNTFFMAIDHYESAKWLVKSSEIANLFFTVVFAIEMVLKLFGFGCAQYVSDGFNVFDAFIVIMSYVELIVASEGESTNSSLSVLRAFRLLRIFKIIKSWDSLRILLSTVLDSLTAITNLGVLIGLFIFISSLLTKQFFHEPLKNDDDSISRYSFSSTGEAVVTVFIILTGENWNEIMIQVIVQTGSFGPSLFFIFLMLLGNFMLLNLFLAILLKSISSIGESDEEEEGGNKTEAKNEEAEVEADKMGGLNDSAPLNSSNSNIEEEFEQIKLQLMALSNNMNQMLEGNAKNKQQEGFGSDQDMSEDVDNEDKMNKNKKKADMNLSESVKIGQQTDEEEEEELGNSLFIFSPTNPLRVFLRNFIMNSYFAGFIYHMIALNSMLLSLDEPKLEDPFQKKTIALMLLIISIIFVFECVIKIIAQGFYFDKKTYLRDPWNILDFIIVMFSIITWVLEAVMDGADMSFIRGFRALRALRPLRVVSKNEGIKTVVNSLLESIPALLNVLLIVLLFLLVFGILGIQLFKGQLGRCSDDSDEIQQAIQWKYDCVGYYWQEIVNEYGQQIGQQRVMREWTTPFNNYNDIMHSMMTFFEISTLEMWPGMMYDAIDSVALDHVPITNNNKMIAIIFIFFIFFTTFFIMNLFISVIVDKFNEEIKKRQGADNFTDEQKEWVKIQRLLVHTNPKIIPVEPINCFRLQCFKVVQSQAFEYIVMAAIVVNTVFLCIDYYHKSDELAKILDESNLTFVVFFTLELLIKLTAYGFKYYWYVNWNKFDLIIVAMSLIALDEELLKALNFNPTALRIIRVSRLLRMVKTSEGLRTLLKTLFMSLGNIINTALLLILILFTFAVAGMSLFGEIEDDEFLNHNVNFKSFYIAMMTLWRCATGESWNGIMHECFYAQSIVAVCYWLLYQLIAFFIFMNVFIAVIGESFNDNQATEDENDILALKKKDIKAFQNTWAKYNPMGELYMRTIRLPDFLRELPPPLGYQGIRIEESKLNKIIFCLNIRDHLGRVYYPEVMWTIFHSIAGMNDDKVLNCEQIITILKIVKQKYKGLGKKVNLDSLCGNKYYRKELTAIKYIQAMKILTKWRNFKNLKIKMKDQQMNLKSLSPDAQEDEAPRKENNQNGQRKQPQRAPSNNQVQRQAPGRAQNYQQDEYYSEEEPVQQQQQPPQSSRRGRNMQEDEEDFDNLADQDMGMTERNPMSARGAGAQSRSSKQPGRGQQVEQSQRSRRR